jgi:ring-1,2-phenylacetyl-CoA epoxidase subunit PaaD
MTLKDKILKILDTITDPELPVLTVLDLGIVRDVFIENQDIEVKITPTYSGCPAMNVIEMNIRIALEIEGYKKVKITTILSPAWTTDWMSKSGKQKLKAYGIAPPQNKARLNKMLFETPPSVNCPKCDAENTELLAEFGSTSCKSLYRCKACLEPFDYFKCH